MRVSGHMRVPIRHILPRHTRRGGGVPRFLYDDGGGQTECSALSLAESIAKRSLPLLS